MTEFRHHGLPLLMESTRRISPSDRESEQGVKEVIVIPGICAHPECRKRTAIVQYDYGTHLGIKNQLKNTAQIASIISRLKLAPPSDSVQGTVKEKNSDAWLFRDNISVA